MDISRLVFYAIALFFGILLFLNLIKVFINIFSKPKVISVEKEDPLLSEIRLDIKEQVQPHLTSLEGMYKKSDLKAPTLAAFVFSVFKDKFSSHIEKNEKLVEEEICKCCSEYESSECKESFCLEGTGLSCPS